MNRKNLGTEGEKKAEEFLNKKGYQILERNYRTRLGEIDIVALDDDIVVFAEIKTRQSVYNGLPRESVNYRKQMIYGRLALQYLQSKKWIDHSARFDVLEVYIGNDNTDIIHIKNAFEFSNRRYFY